MLSRSSKTLTSLRHHRRGSQHTVRHHHHLTYQSCSTPHLTCTHHVSTHASHSTTTWIADSTQTPVMAQSLQPLPCYTSADASWWCWSARTDRERAPLPDSQQRGLPTQYCSHNADKPPSLTHTHSHSESTATTHRSCCQSSDRRIVPAAVLLVAVTVVKDIDEFETSLPWISAYSPPPSP